MSLADSLAGFVEPPKPSAPHNAGKAKAVRRPLPEQSGEKRVVGKSRNPDFQKLTVYVREKTRKTVAIKLLEEGQGREVSELVEELLNVWTTKRSDV